MDLLDKTPNEPSKFRTKNYVEVKEDSRQTDNNNSNI